MATMLDPAAPAADRLAVVDALRGFALFGILLANILYWSGWGMSTPEQRIAWVGATADLWQYRFHHLFVDGKFYTLFSFLFGAGFALQLARLVQRGHDGLRIYRRRVLVLLGIGLVHSWLIWDGDILVVYALLGLLLPYFHRWSTRALLVTGALLVFVVPFAGLFLFEALGWAPQHAVYGLGDRITLALGADPDPAKVVAWMQREDWRGIATWLATGPTYSLGLRIESWRFPKVLGIMLVGMAAGRGLADGTLLANRALLKRVLIYGLAIGVPASLAYALIPKQGQADWPSLIGTAPLAMAYAAAFVLAWPRASDWLGVFVAPGQMALTNYLSQSVINGLVFYGIGLGLVGRLPAWGIYGYAVALFATQALFSRWWLSRHAQGPMEALWRRWTYGRASTAIARS
jgi:uncharacterized protein